MNRINWIKVWNFTAIALGLVVVTVLMVYSGMRQSGVRCGAISITLPDSERFVSEKAVLGLLDHGQKIIGTKVDSLDLSQVGNRIRTNPFVAATVLSVDLSGILRIKVYQKHPLILVQNAKGHKFYIDTHGLKMPWFPYDTSRFYEVSGSIEEDFNKVDTLKSNALRQVYYYALLLKENPRRRRYISRFSIREDHDLEILGPLGRNFQFVLGDTTDALAKLERMDIMYAVIFPRTGFETYSLINLKYADELICTKNETKK